MNKKNSCKGCSGSTKVSENIIQTLIMEAEKDKSSIVSDELYKKRIEICDQCPSLQYRTTCAHSGSIVRYQAKLIKQTCPFPRKSKWEMISI